MTSGLNTNFNLSPSYLFHKSLSRLSFSQINRVTIITIIALESSSNWMLRTHFQGFIIQQNSLKMGHWRALSVQTGRGFTRPRQNPGLQRRALSTRE